MRPPNRLKPSFLLKDVKRLVESEKFRVTTTCLMKADSLGFTESDILDVIGDLEQKDFLHSVSQNDNPKLWQDVYSKTVNCVCLYIKFQVKTAGEENLLILSFHEFNSGY